MNKTDWRKTKEVLDKLFELFPDEVGLCDGSFYPYVEWKKEKRITFRFDTDFEDAWYGAWIEVEKWESNEENDVTHEVSDKTTYRFKDIDSAFLKLKELLGGE